MIISIEVDLIPEYHEYDDGRVSLEALKFKGCNQNILQFLSISEQDAAQQALEDEVEKAISDKLAAVRERKEMRCDIAREFQQDTLVELQAQRGVRL